MVQVLCTALGAEEGPHFELLSSAGWGCTVVDRDLDLWDASALRQALEGFDAVIAGSEPYPRDVLEASAKLRVISRTGVGYDNANVPVCDERGIVVATTPGVNHHSVAEQTIAFLMALARGFPRLDQEVRHGVWNRVARPRVMGRTLGLVGLGRIGQATATRAIGLGMRVLATDPAASPDFAEQNGITLVPLSQLLAESDYVSLHCPAVPETQHLLNTETLKQTKPGVVIINTSRGALIDEPALIEALQSGHVRAAGLDVFETEPLPSNSPLLNMDQVMLSGHVAGLDQESHEATFAMAATTCLQLSRGEWPTECIQNIRLTPDTWRWQAT